MSTSHASSIFVERVERARPTLFERLETIGHRSPARPAIIHGESTVTYGTLARRARDLCGQLEAAGIERGDRVAVVLPNGPEFVVAAFALWKHGAILVPLHVRFQEDEIHRYITDCGVRSIITSRRMSSEVQSIQERNAGVAHAWLWEPDGSGWTYQGRRGAVRHAPLAGTRAFDVDPTAPALTQYSTGSTGFSKRVTRTHENLIGEFHAIAEVLGITSEDRILGVAPFFHNYGLMNGVICGMLSGATLYTMEDFFPRDVARLIESERITGFPGVPFMHQLLADLRGSADLTSLRYALSAGAPLAETTATAFRAAYGVPIRQLYGSTETGVISIAPPPNGEGGDSSVGFPIRGVTVRVLDDAGQPVPDGVEGNVAVTSAYAAGAYDNLAGAGESHFTDGAFLPGDLGSLTADGRLTLSGRKRQFINVAGNKVDPSEVEAVLREIPAVSEAVVVGVADGAASEKIKAVLVTGAPCTRQEVVDQCAAKLADFKRPRVIEFRKEIPKSPLGKILRKYLMDEYEAGPRHVFDPRSGFRAAPDAPGAEGPPDLSTVPPFLRAILVTDGTVTKNLEAYFWEPIGIDLLLHAAVASEQAHPAIEVEPGDSIVRRRVVLRGRITGLAYAFAETVLASDRIPPEIRRSLVEDRIGIGELLRANRLETYRELTDVGRAAAGEWAAHLGIEPTAAVLVRTYRIYLERRASIQIVEVFPESRFQV